MSAADYRFVTRWRIRGPRTLVYKIISEAEAYPRWWKPAYVACEKVGEKDIRATVRARLPYTLTFTTHLTEEKPPEGFTFRATGELDGTGSWRLQEDGSLTRVEFFWNVRATKPLVQRLSFFLKPLFVWNHNWVMNTGEKALQIEVDRNLALREA